MAKMSNATRDAIVVNAVEKAGLNDEREQIYRSRAILAEGVRIDSLGGSDNVKKLEKLLSDTALSFVMIIGANPAAAEYGGISVRKQIILAMTISGAKPNAV